MICNNQFLFVSFDIIIGKLLLIGTIRSQRKPCMHNQRRKTEKRRRTTNKRNFKTHEQPKNTLHVVPKFHVAVGHAAVGLAEQQPHVRIQLRERISSNMASSLPATHVKNAFLRRTSRKWCALLRTSRSRSRTVPAWYCRCLQHNTTKSQDVGLYQTTRQRVRNDMNRVIY